MNPGSPDAVKAGCTCPIMDNDGGRGSGFPKDGSDEPTFWVDSYCPIHARPLARMRLERAFKERC